MFYFSFGQSWSQRGRSPNNILQLKTSYEHEDTNGRIVRTVVTKISSTSLFHAEKELQKRKLENISVLWLAHHHLAELVEVHGPAAVLVQLGDDPVQLLVGEGTEELGN